MGYGLIDSFKEKFRFDWYILQTDSDFDKLFIIDKDLISTDPFQLCRHLLLQWHSLMWTPKHKLLDNISWPILKTDSLEGRQSWQETVLKTASLTLEREQRGKFRPAVDSHSFQTCPAPVSLRGYTGKHQHVQLQEFAKCKICLYMYKIRKIHLDQFQRYCS